MIFFFCLFALICAFDDNWGWAAFWLVLALIVK